MRSLLSPAILGLYTGWSVSSHPHLRLSPAPSRWRSDRNVSMAPRICAPAHCRHSPPDSLHLRNPTHQILNPSPSPSRVLTAILTATHALRHLAHIAARLYHYAVHVLAPAPHPHILESIPPTTPSDCNAPCDAKEEPPDTERHLHSLPGSELESPHALRRLIDAPSSDHHDENPIFLGQTTDFDSTDPPIILLPGSSSNLEDQPLAVCASSNNLAVDQLVVDYYPSPPDSTLARPSRHSRRSGSDTDHSDRPKHPPIELQVSTSTDGLQIFTHGDTVYRQLRGVMPVKSCITVHSAENVATGQLVAIKLFEKDEPFRRAEPVALKAFMARRKDTPGHSFVIELLSSAERHAVHKFLITPLYKQDLFTYLCELKEEPNMEIVTIWAAELVSGLAFIHQRGWAHRDLKPDNILISEFNHLCITDFGLAMRLTDENCHIVEIKGKDDYVGTPGYYCPEMTDRSQTRKLVKLEPADIWGLGVIMLQITVGSLCDLARAERSGWRLILGEYRETILEKDKAAYKLLGEVLVTDPALRLDINEIKEHDFFEPIDWEILDGGATLPLCHIVEKTQTRRKHLDQENAIV